MLCLQDHSKLANNINWHNFNFLYFFGHVMFRFSFGFLYEIMSFISLLNSYILFNIESNECLLLLLFLLFCLMTGVLTWSENFTLHFYCWLSPSAPSIYFSPLNHLSTAIVFFFQEWDSLQLFLILRHLNLIHYLSFFIL